MPSDPGSSSHLPQTGAPVVLDATAMARLAWEVLHGVDDARAKLLWEQGGSTVGLLHVHPRGHVRAHAHPEAHHHAWVVDGHARMLGEPVGPGSYVHIPAGMEHEITDVGPQGVTMFYVYQMVGTV